jgi:hypothetical protein
MVHGALTRFRARKYVLTGTLSSTLTLSAYRESLAP